MRTPGQALASSPTMVGAITVLVTVVAMFLSYNANNGLPFVPVYRVALEVPNSARLNANNEVRLGGNRIGVVESLDLTPPEDETDPAPKALLTLKLDKSAQPLPQDSIFRIRYRSFFGLKFVEVVRGTGEPAPEGFTFIGTDDGGECMLPVDLETFASQIPDTARNGCFQSQTEGEELAAAFDAPTRQAFRANLTELSSALAGRGVSLNRAIDRSPRLLAALKPVAETLSDPATRLERFIIALSDTAAATAPVSEAFADSFRGLRATMEAFSRDPAALAASISGAVPLVEQSPPLLARARPLLDDSAELLRRLDPGIAALPETVPILNRAFRVGAPVLARTPRTADDLRGLFVELRRTVDQPSTKITIDRLGGVLDDVRELGLHVAPAQTTCNYFNYFATFLGEHLSQRTNVGFQQRNIFVQYPQDPPPVNVLGTTFDIDGEVHAPTASYSGLPADALAGPGPDPSKELEFQPDKLPVAHGPIDAPHGQLTPEYPDCAAGQFGYPLGDLRVPGQPVWSPTILEGDYPGSVGRTNLFFNAEGERELRDTHVPSRQPTTWARTFGIGGNGR